MVERICQKAKLQSVRSVHLKLKSGEIFMVIDLSELNSESKMEDLWVSRRKSFQKKTLKLLHDIDTNHVLFDLLAQH